MASATSLDIDDPDEGFNRAAETPADDCDWAAPPARRPSAAPCPRWHLPALGLENFS